MENEITTSETKAICKSQGNSHGITIEDIDEVIQRDCSQGLWSNDCPSTTMTSVDPKGRSLNSPYVIIIEQPASKSLRFRYECEGRSAGSLPGANSTQDNKTFPTIQVVNSKGPAVVVVSLVTKDEPFRPHPHKLVGKDGCRNGICTLTVNNESMTCAFSNLGIQCVKKKDVDDALKEREKLRVDPFMTGFEHRNQTSNIDLNSVRLCFQVFVEGADKGQFTKPLKALVSDAIYDKKAMSELIICKLSACSGSVKGGTEIILLCEKISKDDTEVVLSEVRDGRVLWEALGDFQPNDVHKQVAISFRTPPYRDQNIVQPVEVRLQLRRRSDMTTSDPRAFQYTPLDLDPECLEKKRRKVGSVSLRRYLDQNTSLPSSVMKNEAFATANPEMYPYTSNVNVDLVRQRIYRAPQRRHIKQETDPRVPAPQGYSFPAADPVFQSGHNIFQMPTPAQSPLAERMQISPNPMQMATASSVSPMPCETSAPNSYSSGIQAAMNIVTNMGEPDSQVVYYDSSNFKFDDVDKSSASAATATAAQDENQMTSLDLNISFDSAEIKDLVQFNDASINALMSDNSLNLSSLESAMPSTPDGINRLHNEIMFLNQLGQNVQNQQ